MEETVNGILKESQEKYNTEHEAISLTQDRLSSPNCATTSATKTYERKRKAKKELQFDEKIATSGISAKAMEITNMEPVKCTFESPPKRTYGHGQSGKPKTPQLDITLTCYCRCHIRNEEKHREMLKTIENMKKNEEEQSQTIENLLSQNKISEHLLKTKSKRIAELLLGEKHLRKEVEKLRATITSISRQQIKAAPNASEDSIIYARMVCGKQRKYTKKEVLLAQKIYSVSPRCYNFMRGVLTLNLPHTTTLKRQRQLNAASNLVSQQGRELSIENSYSEENAKEEYEEYQDDLDLLVPMEPSSNITI